MKRPIGVVLHPFVNFGRLVGRDVVEDDMNLGSGLDPLGDEVEEIEKFLRAVTLDHLAGGDIKSHHRAGSSVSLIIVSPGGFRDDQVSSAGALVSTPVLGSTFSFPLR